MKFAEGAHFLEIMQIKKSQKWMKSSGNYKND